MWIILVTISLYSLDWIPLKGCGHSDMALYLGHCAACAAALDKYTTVTSLATKHAENASLPKKQLGYNRSSYGPVQYRKWSGFERKNIKWA